MILAANLSAEAGAGPWRREREMETVRKPRGRYFPLCAVLIEIWTALLAVGVSVTGVFVSCFLLPLAPLIWAFILPHLILFDRVVERRRWAYLTTTALGLLYLLPPTSWRDMTPAGLGIAGLLCGLGVAVLTAWDDLEGGW